MATQKLYAGAKLRELRGRLGLTQRIFADKLGVSLPYLNQMENNHRPVSAAVVLGLGEDRRETLIAKTRADAEQIANDYAGMIQSLLALPSL